MSWQPLLGARNYKIYITKKSLDISQKNDRSSSLVVEQVQKPPFVATNLIPATFYQFQVAANNYAKVPGLLSEEITSITGSFHDNNLFD